ncbi:MAG: hypothetical protein QOD41_1378 [Cryptosporangiaceae bacterium]|nr:hypothetical protein [Cryptosporangiaceae bacterium]
MNAAAVQPAIHPPGEFRRSAFCTVAVVPAGAGQERVP